MPFKNKPIGTRKVQIAAFPILSRGKSSLRQPSLPSRSLITSAGDRTSSRPQGHSAGGRSSAARSQPARVAPASYALW